MTMHLDPDTHVYWDDADPDTDYVSVSHVIRNLGIRKSFHGVDRAVLDFAAERGKAVENILYSLIQGQQATVDVPEWEQRGKTLQESVMEFVPGIQNWLANGAPEYVAHQVIVSDKEAGIAGTLDLLCDELLIDVKCVSRLEEDFSIQLGAYASMLDGWYGELAILHIKPSLNKQGYRFILYDKEDCLKKWSHARAAWMESKAAFARAREAILA